METPCATVETCRKGGPRVLLQGDVDFRNAQIVREAVRSATREAGDPIVLDLRSLTFIDSSGISALVGAARHAREWGRGLRLEGASPLVLQLLCAAGFTGFFQATEGEPIPRLTDGSAAVLGRLGGETSANGASMTYHPSPSRVWQHTSFAIPARIGLVSHIRKRVSEMLESLSPGEELLDAVRLAVGEAASNAVRHGCRGDDRMKVRVRSATDGHTLVVEISDPGPGFDPDQIPQPEAGELREGGMGIYFMRLTMDEVSYIFDGPGTTVRLVKRLDPQPPVATA